MRDRTYFNGNSSLIINCKSFLIKDCMNVPKYAERSNWAGKAMHKMHASLFRSTPVFLFEDCIAFSDRIGQFSFILVPNRSLNSLAGFVHTNYFGVLFWCLCYATQLSHVTACWCSLNPFPCHLVLITVTLPKEVFQKQSLLFFVCYQAIGCFWGFSLGFHMDKAWDLLDHTPPFSSMRERILHPWDLSFMGLLRSTISSPRAWR